MSINETLKADEGGPHAELTNSSKKNMNDKNNHENGDNSCSVTPPRPSSLLSVETKTINVSSITTTETPLSGDITPTLHSIRMRRIPSQIRLALMSLKRDQVVWEEMEDDLYILLDGNVASLEAFRKFYFDMHLPKSSSRLLRSLAYLCSSKANDMAIHDEHVSRLACFLSIGRDDPELKRMALKTMMICLSPLSSGKNEAPTTVSSSWQVQDEVIERTLQFLIRRDSEWEYGVEHSAMPLIYELRAKCLRELDLKQERIRRMADKGDEAAVLIATGAKLMEIGIYKSNKVIKGHIDSAGEKVKDWVEVSDNPLLVDRNAVVAMTFSDAAKRASECARQGTKLAVENICDASITGLYMVGNKLDQADLPPEGVGILKAAGKVGMATVGAAALVGEALVGSSRSISNHAAGVVADVVGHKYGVTAGELAKNAADTADNCFRALGNVALIEGNILAKTVAKTVGKEQIEKDVEKAKETIQLLEKNASKMMSQTLGIHWKGNWTKDLLALESTHASDNSPSLPTLAGENQENLERYKVVADVSSISATTIESKVLSAHETKKSNNEENSTSDTGSLTSSISTRSTEHSAYKIARRGTPSQRKRTPLRPDSEPFPFSSPSSSRRCSHSSGRRLSRHGKQRTHLTPYK
jgi:hypothetical protein